MAQHSVAQRGISIRLACVAFAISGTCYRYTPKLSAENEQIADWLIRLTHNQRNWGFGLCFLYLRNVKGYGWNHKRVYRIYQGAGIESADQPPKALEAGQARAADGPPCHQPGLVHGFHARSAHRRAQLPVVQRTR